MVTVNSDGKRGNNMSEKIESQTVTMAHGAGGKQTSELIDKVFAAHFANPDLTADDAAVLNPPVGKMAVSTDGFIVSPAFFPGGNIGKLSICGTVNDLACMGAKPLYLTCAFVIEEGFPMEKLEQIAEAMAKTAKEAGVRIVSGDTKVAGKGQVDGWRTGWRRTCEARRCSYRNRRYRQTWMHDPSCERRFRNRGRCEERLRPTLEDGGGCYGHDT